MITLISRILIVILIPVFFISAPYLYNSDILHDISGGNVALLALLKISSIVIPFGLAFYCVMRSITYR